MDGDVIDPEGSTLIPDCPTCVSAIGKHCDHDGYMRMHCSLCDKCAFLDYNIDCAAARVDVQCLESAFWSIFSANSEKNLNCLGTFTWTCLDCQEKVKRGMHPAASIDEPPSWLPGLTNMLESKFRDIAADIANFKLQVSDQLQQVGSPSSDPPTSSPFRKTPDITNTHSPLRKRKLIERKSTYSDALQKPKSSSKSDTNRHVFRPSIAAGPITTFFDNQASKSTKSRAKINVLSDQCESALKTLNQDSQMIKSFTAKPKVDGSIDFVFDTLSKATNAKNSLAKKMDNLKVSDVVPLDTSRWNVVGLPFKISVGEAVESLIASNHDLSFVKCTDEKFENCINVAHYPDALLKVIDVRKNRNGGKYRVVISMNEQMKKLIKCDKLKVFNVVCKMYSLDNNNRCYQCHEDGHLSHSCKSEVVCAFCAGPHRAGSAECTATTPSCIRCIKAKHNDTNHAVYSSKCPFNK